MSNLSHNSDCFIAIACLYHVTLILRGERQNDETKKSLYLFDFVFCGGNKLPYISYT